MTQKDNLMTKKDKLKIKVQRSKEMSENRFKQKGLVSLFDQKVDKQAVY